jgi:hypothetical protein
MGILATTSTGAEAEDRGFTSYAPATIMNEEVMKEATERLRGLTAKAEGLFNQGKYEAAAIAFFASKFTGTDEFELGLAADVTDHYMVSLVESIDPKNG